MHYDVHFEEESFHLLATFYCGVLHKIYGILDTVHSLALCSCSGGCDGQPCHLLNGSIAHELVKHWTARAINLSAFQIEASPL